MLLENAIGGRKWGKAETYDHNRNPDKGKNYVGKGENLPQWNISRKYNNMLMVVNNCDEWGKMIMADIPGGNGVIISIMGIIR